MTRGRIVVTGATGFVGNALLECLAVRGTTRLRAVVRCRSPMLPAPVEQAAVGDIGDRTEWSEALRGADVVVHLAARVHVMRDCASDPLEEFRRINVSGSLRLAEQAAAAGVRRLVFLSSVKVNGEEGTYRETDLPAPEDPYAVSKSEAETGLRAIAVRTGMELVVIRPPLVYGPEVKGNFRRLMRAVRRGIPLPFGAVHNKRSLVALENLVSFIVTCIELPSAANETFLVSDREDISTTDLIRRLARAMDRRAWLVPVPAPVLSVGAALMGRHAAVRRLLGSLQVDASKADRLLGWVPPISVDEGLKRAVRGR